MRVGRITNARIMFHYGLSYARGDTESAPDAIQGIGDALENQRNPAFQQQATSGDSLEISDMARDLYESSADVDETVTWEDSKRQIANPEDGDESYIYEQSHREAYNAGASRITWEETHRNFYNGSHEEQAQEETRREEINLGDEILIKEQTRRVEPRTGKETIIWEQTRRKTVNLEDGTIAMERSRRQFFNVADEGQAAEEQRSANFYQQQAATAYRFGVSIENAYRMNVEGYEWNERVISLAV